MAMVDFESYFNGRDLFEHAVRTSSSLGDATLPAGVADDPPAVARAEHGRWIVDCPLCLVGAEFADYRTALFFCTECRNAAVGNKCLRVQLPTPDRRAQVEAYLLARPLLATRNWRQDEPVARLQAENKENGIRL